MEYYLYILYSSRLDRYYVEISQEFIIFGRVGSRVIFPKLTRFDKRTCHVLRKYRLTINEYTLNE